MRSIKIAALSLASMLTVGVAMAGNAAAGPLWLLCLEGGAKTTKYSSNQCNKVESSGKWEAVGLAAGKADTIRLTATTLTLRDTKTLLGESEVQCYASGIESAGYIEGPNKSVILEAKYSSPATNCRGFKVCKEKEVTEIKSVHTPWKMEMFETESKFLSKILPDGNGQPGWKVACNTTGGPELDECTAPSGEEEQMRLTNRESTGVLLVVAEFSRLHKAECTVSEEKSGEVMGQLVLLLNSGNGLSINAK